MVPAASVVAAAEPRAIPAALAAALGPVNSNCVKRENKHDRRKSGK